MIPKKIHYCWFGKNPIPKILKKCIKSWKKNCPDYEIIRWDESNFDFKCNKFAKQAYDCKAWAFVSDYARMKIIYEEGGIYLDTDVEILKTFDELLACNAFFAAQQLDGLVGTGLCFGAEPKNKIVHEMLSVYEKVEFDNENRDKIICPILNTNVLYKYGYEKSDKIIDIEGVKIYPPKYFDPLSPGKSDDLVCEETFSIHHYSATWTKGRQKVKRKIVNLIGQRNINKIKRFFRYGSK